MKNAENEKADGVIPLNTVRWMGQILLRLARVFIFINSEHHLLSY